MKLFQITKEIHGDKYQYENIDYKNAIIKIEITCKKHGVFTQKPDHHLRGHGCRKCSNEKNAGAFHSNWNSNRSQVKLIASLGQRSSNFLKRTLCQTNQIKINRKHEILGYSTNELLNHITNHPNWEKVKNTKWSIDHIFPIKAFVEHGIHDMKIINSLNNLQPMKFIDNCRKSGNYNEIEFLEYIKNI